MHIRTSRRPHSTSLFNVGTRYWILSIKLLVIETKHICTGSDMSQDLTKAVAGKYIQAPKRVTKGSQQSSSKLHDVDE